MKIVTKDNGYLKLEKRAKELSSDLSVTVGIHQEEGTELKKKHNGEASEISLVDVAYFQEIGLGVPQRSFIGAWADTKQYENAKQIHDVAQLMLLSKVSIQGGLTNLGKKFQSGIKDRIENRDPPFYADNAESTIKKKGSDVPLIDTGQLLNSIKYKIKFK